VSPTRRWGVALTAAAVALWGATVATIVVMAPQGGGTNLGGVLLFLLALPCTLAGPALIAGSRSRPAHAADARPAHAPIAPTINLAAAWALGLGIVALLLGFVPLAGDEIVTMAQLAGTLLLALVALVLGAVGLRRARRGNGQGSLVLGAIIVAAAALGLHGVLLPQLIDFVSRTF
jgi:hypothetical protein